MYIKHLNAKLNPICHLLVLLGAHHIFHFSKVRVNLLAFCKFFQQIFIKLMLFTAAFFSHEIKGSRSRRILLWLREVLQDHTNPTIKI